MGKNRFPNLILAIVAGFSLAIALVGAAAAQEPGDFYAGLTQYEAVPWQEIQLSGCWADPERELWVTVFPVGGDSEKESEFHAQLGVDGEDDCFAALLYGRTPGTKVVWIRQYAGGGEPDPDNSVRLILTVVGEVVSTPVPPMPTPRPIVAPMALTMTLPATATTGSVVTVTLVVSPTSAWPMEMSIQVGRMAPLEWRGSSPTQTLTFTPTVATTLPMTATVKNSGGNALVTGTLVVTGENLAVAPIVGLAPTGGEAPVEPRINPLVFLGALLAIPSALALGWVGWRNRFRLLGETTE